MDNLKNNFNEKLRKFKKFVSENNNQKLKSLTSGFETNFKDLEEAFKGVIEAYDNELAKMPNVQKMNDDYLKKIVAIQDDASKKVAEKIEELTSKKKEEIEEAKKYAIEKSIMSAINVLDQLEIALSYAVMDPAVKNYVSGFRMVSDMFLRWLNELNIQKIPMEAGDPFDEQKMSAYEKVPSHLPKNHVAKISKSAYTLHDRVIRHAVVSVSDGSLADYNNAGQQTKTVAITPHAVTQAITPSTTNETHTETQQISRPTVQSIPPRVVRQQPTQQVLHHVEPQRVTQTISQHPTHEVGSDHNTKKV
ncbi:nucleotide exchange factor GrpE [[Mycoplasma] testudinis]|uniref:nucleotide exchange factor GrpE n=1 Tax=[Mycoplasma] testudinis TaxID=33924 RepID=UPI000696551E|nr:nucleotide exchange factor GrpE [[Mycoplasma] testudinis]